MLSYYGNDPDDSHPDGNWNDDAPTAPPPGYWVTEQNNPISRIHWSLKAALDDALQSYSAAGDTIRVTIGAGSMSLVEFLPRTMPAPAAGADER